MCKKRVWPSSVDESVILDVDFFFDFFDVFTQKRTRVNAPIRFANARSWLVVLVIGKK